MCDRASGDAYGNDADRVEFRFRDANNRIDLKCARASVPGTWLTVSHISGPTLINAIQEVRRQRARVEGPEQTEQFAQLAAVHSAWFNAAFTTDRGRVGALITFVGGLDAGNFHIQCTLVVPLEALANMSHDRGQELPAPAGPLAVTANSWQQAASSSRSMASLTDQRDGGNELDRTRYELQVRSFGAAPQFHQEQETTRGHLEDHARDAARANRSFARSTAQLTPGMFAGYMGSNPEANLTEPSSSGREPVIEELVDSENQAGSTSTTIAAAPPTQEVRLPAGAAATEAQDPRGQGSSRAPPLIGEEVDTEAEVDNEMPPAPEGPPQSFRPHRTP